MITHSTTTTTTTTISSTNITTGIRTALTVASDVMKIIVAPKFTMVTGSVLTLVVTVCDSAVSVDSVVTVDSAVAVDNDWKFYYYMTVRSQWASLPYGTFILSV